MGVKRVVAAADVPWNAQGVLVQKGVWAKQWHCKYPKHTDCLAIHYKTGT